VKRFLGPQFKMSKTCFKLCDSLLEFWYFPLVEVVFSAADEPNIARFVAPISVDAIHVKFRRVPPIQRDNVLEELASVGAPRFAYVYAASSVVVVILIAR
jgi:hypothetical protein